MIVLQPVFWYHTAGVLLLAGIFYLIVPGVGAFHIRSSWRRFRTLLLGSASLPSLTYSALRDIKMKGSEEGVVFHFYGSLQAMQGDTEIWLTDGSVTVRADLEKTYVYLLPFASMPEEDFGDQHPMESPRRVRWEQISSLPEHTRIFISGKLFRDEGHFTFRNRPEHPLLAVIYEGEDRDLRVRATWSGRQRNEYWNAYTPASISLGSFALFGYSYLLFRNAVFLLPAVLSLSLALLPISVFIPPGIICYYFYRRFWIHGRILRAGRDLLRLSEVDQACREFIAASQGYLRECGAADTLSPAERAQNCEKKAFLYEGFAVLVFGLGVLLTLLLVFLLITYLVR